MIFWGGNWPKYLDFNETSFFLEEHFLWALSIQFCITYSMQEVQCVLLSSAIKLCLDWVTEEVHPSVGSSAAPPKPTDLHFCSLGPLICSQYSQTLIAVNFSTVHNSVEKLVVPEYIRRYWRHRAFRKIPLPIFIHQWHMFKKRATLTGLYLLQEKFHLIPDHPLEYLCRAPHEISGHNSWVILWPIPV